MEKAKVYFSSEISPSSAVRLYKALCNDLKGKVAVKVHSGEAGNQNFLRPEFVKPLADYVNGTIVECNTAYGEAFGGERDTTEKHMKVLDAHGWSKLFNVDLMDSCGPDLEIAIDGGQKIKKNYIGKNLKNYDSLLIFSHFKGHPVGGYGGALKQLSIGCASSAGKAYIHSAGATTDSVLAWQAEVSQDDFLCSMADAASTVVKMFGKNAAYINVMANLSVDCDCCIDAEDPCMKDIGILSSLDPIALDQACIDLIYNSDDPGRNHFIERVERQHGIHTIEAAANLGFGTREYTLIEI